VKRWLTAAALLLLSGVLAYRLLNRVDSAPGAAPALAGAPPTAPLLARGKYLATAADCIACHTVAGSGKAFAGGLAFKLPVGVIYSSNITADPINGIGAWSDADFLRAVQDGVGKDGEHLYPAFPYTAYTQLSRDDVLAIKAYLMSLPAIPKVNRRNELNFPFNQRWAIGIWNAAFFRDRRFAADPAKSAAWNGGAYLAALGHCGECHTPRNPGFGLKHGEELAGADLQGWRAYNITADPKYGIGAWSDAEIAQYLRSGVAAGHASANGPMGEAVAHSLQFLDPADIDALIVYLRTVAARAGNHPIEVERRSAPLSASAGTASGPAEEAAHGLGLELFEGACAGCHQWSGTGLESPYAALQGSRGVNDASGANVTQAILQGAAWRIGDREVFMPAFGNAYSSTEVAALANYVIAHFGGKQGTVTPAQVAERRGL